MSSHTRISPSKLARIIACPASLKFVEGLKLAPGTSQAAEEGSRLHDMMYRYMLTGATPTDALAKWAAASIEPYIEGVTEFMLEERFEIDAGLDVSGTADMVFVNDGCLTVLDYKFGQHPVKARGNAQLMAYAYGVLKKYTQNNPWPTDIKLIIVQPKLEVTDQWMTTPEQIVNWWTTEARPSCLSALSGVAPFEASEEACRWCEGRAYCKACTRLASDVAAEVFSAFSDDSPVLPDEEVIKLYKRSSIIRSQLHALDSRVRQILAKGPKYGLKLVRARGRRAWTFSTDEEKLKTIDKLTELGVDAFTAELKSVPVLLKEYPFLKKDEDIMRYISMAPGASMNIVNESDSRSSVSEDPFSGYYEKEK